MQGYWFFKPFVKIIQEAHYKAKVWNMRADVQHSVPFMVGQKAESPETLLRQENMQWIIWDRNEKLIL